MSEIGRRHGGATAETGGGEQLLAEEASGDLSSLSWRLNVKEFQLPPSHHHRNNSPTYFTFHRLFSKPSKTFLSSFSSFTSLLFVILFTNIYIYL